MSTTRQEPTIAELQKPAVRPPRALRATFALAIFYAVSIATITIAAVWNDLANRNVSASIPVAPYSPTINPTLKLDGVAATLIGAQYDHATLTVAGLGIDSRLWLAAATLTAALAQIIVALTIALLCHRVATGNPFTRIVPRAITISGIAILAGGLLSQICARVAALRVIDTTLNARGAHWLARPGTLNPTSAAWPHGNVEFAIDLWPLGIALALFALAVVFRYGAKLQRDRDALLDEVKGLV